MSHAEIRALCHAEAMKWVDVQRDQFRRLGVSGDWDNPYLTLDPRYEAGILDVLADLLDDGYVFRQLKPIHWCMTDRTALAEAELEYQRRDHAEHLRQLPDGLAACPTSLGPPGPWHAMIWTTTPWTLPANVAIAVHPDLEYAGVRYVDPATGQTVHTILAADLVAKVMALREGHRVRRGRPRAGARSSSTREYRHPFIDRVSPIVLADYVSVEDGTGLVHTAPGHGAEDYQTGRATSLPTLSPVDASGRFTAEAPDWLAGQQVFAANPAIVDASARRRGTCSTSCSFVHSYPHCWRCKKPVIFRATEQWFIGVDHNDLRGRTLKAIDDVTLASRLGPVADRGDGLAPSRLVHQPPAVLGRADPRAGLHDLPARQLLTAETVRHFRDLFRTEGADAWFTRPVEELLPPGAACPKCGGTDVPQGGGHPRRLVRVGLEPSRRARRPSFGLGYPAFMYLEGSDQHRGWFQSSILTAVGSDRHAPRSRPC